MAAQKGKDLLIQLGDGATPESFATVAGITARTIALHATTVDATDAASPGGWRELMAGAGARSLAVSGSGVFRDSAADVAMRQAFFDQAARNWRLIVPDFGAFQGPFLITTLEYAGLHEGEASFTIALASAGSVAFSAL